MPIPGWGNVAGVGAALLWRFLDPVRKKEVLLERKKKLVDLPWSEARALELAQLDIDLAKLQREIDRKASS